MLYNVHDTDAIETTANREVYEDKAANKQSKAANLQCMIKLLDHIVLIISSSLI